MAEEEGGSVLGEVLASPLNLLLVALVSFLAYKLLTGRQREYEPPAEPSPELPRLRRDFTPRELRQFDGSGPDGRLLVAVNGKVFDVTRGKRFYGPGGPYAAFAGRDASRGLATFSVVGGKEDEYDDLSDLDKMEMDSVREWEESFQDKYEYVGKLLRPGEQPTVYPEEESSQ
ncbi:membrane-associated progesterone receptor component 1-like [Bacillus rossius redtenbacheri]|uniref:membrane-associated progesterone receptor component 1-like n=1 Tax=Bacillus rossius redtenbacheri TaxID=93214 RepID=UPI002FDDB7B9